MTPWSIYHGGQNTIWHRGQYTMGVKIPYDTVVNIPWGSKYHMTPWSIYHGGQNTIWHRGQYTMGVKIPYDTGACLTLKRVTLLYFYVLNLLNFHNLICITFTIENKQQIVPLLYPNLSLNLIYMWTQSKINHFIIWIILIPLPSLRFSKMNGFHSFLSLKLRHFNNVFNTFMFSTESNKVKSVSILILKVSSILD